MVRGRYIHYYAKLGGTLSHLEPKVKCFNKTFFSGGSRAHKRIP